MFRLQNYRNILEQKAKAPFFLKKMAKKGVFCQLHMSSAKFVLSLRHIN